MHRHPTRRRVLRLHFFPWVNLGNHVARIWYNITQYTLSLLLDKIQQACDIEIWYNICRK